AVVHLSNYRHCDNRFYLFQSGFHGGLINGKNIYQSAFFYLLDHDGRACSLLDFLNYFAARAYYRANQFFIDDQGYRSGRMRLEVWPWFGNGFLHFIENMHSAFMRLLERLPEDVE